jgi:hypothetical protein
LLSVAIPIKEHESVCVPGDSWREYLPSNPLATVFSPLVIYDPTIGSPSVLEMRPEIVWAFTPLVIVIKAKQTNKNLLCISRSKYIQRELLQTLINYYTTIVNLNGEKVLE